MLSEKEFREGTSVTMKDVAEATGIHPVTLSKIGKNRGYNPSLDIVDRLCEYFDCEVNDLLVRVRNDVTNSN
ncbi:helix-turn-helix domain-containing protein [Spongiibacter sp. UBA1325]|jgi:putative transcriptional regulator|uniref:helix-turn-helix domain-containing protein n=1 Tax=Spongiibacter sp. UBA1325 TaxID=1947543 RepID=UPI0039C96675|tara:strand:- start:650 stop:865 length:216 start_codon:yes stop_codon:yes gene_type:complete